MLADIHLILTEHFEQNCLKANLFWSVHNFWLDKELNSRVFQDKADTVSPLLNSDFVLIQIWLYVIEQYDLRGWKDWVKLGLSTPETPYFKMHDGTYSFRIWLYTSAYRRDTFESSSGRQHHNWSFKYRKYV